MEGPSLTWAVAEWVFKGLQGPWRKEGVGVIWLLLGVIWLHGSLHLGWGAVFVVVVPLQQVHDHQEHVLLVSVTRYKGTTT